MTPTNFAYWLQGYFELSDTMPGGVIKLSGAQVTTIKRHLKLVRETAKKRKKGVEPFILWIDTAIDVAVEAKMDSEMLTALLRKKMADTFIHVIDPKYGKHKEELLAVHAGEQKKPVYSPPVPYHSPAGYSGRSGGTSYGC